MSGSGKKGTYARETDAISLVGDSARRRIPEAPVLKPAVRRLSLLAVAAAPALLWAASPAHAGVPVPPLPPSAAPTAVPPATLMSEVVTRTNQQRHANGCGQLEV